MPANPTGPPCNTENSSSTIETLPDLIPDGGSGDSSEPDQLDTPGLEISTAWQDSEEAEEAEDEEAEDEDEEAEDEDEEAEDEEAEDEDAEDEDAKKVRDLGDLACVAFAESKSQGLLMEFNGQLRKYELHQSVAALRSGMSQVVKNYNAGTEAAISNPFADTDTAAPVDTINASDPDHTGVDTSYPIRSPVGSRATSTINSAGGRFSHQQPQSMDPQSRSNTVLNRDETHSPPSVMTTEATGVAGVTAVTASTAVPASTDAGQSDKKPEGNS